VLAGFATDEISTEIMIRSPWGLGHEAASPRDRRVVRAVAVEAPRLGVHSFDSTMTQTMIGFGINSAEGDR